METGSGRQNVLFLPVLRSVKIEAYGVWTGKWRVGLPSKKWKALGLGI